MTEARAPRMRGAPGGAEARRYRYTPELLADGRRRYEQTPERAASIAADFGCHAKTLHKLAQREGWVRYRPPVRGLPAHARLARAAAELEERAGAAPGSGPPSEFANSTEQAQAPLPTTSDPSPPLASRAGGGEREAEPPLDFAQMVDRLEREVNAQIASIERTRLDRKGQPPTRYEAAEIAGVLAALAATLERIRRLRAAGPLSPQPMTTRDDDDLPADLDARRDALARRIEIIVAEWRDAEAAGQAE